MYVADSRPMDWTTAMGQPDEESFRKAAQKEYDQLIENKTWELVDLPKNRKPVNPSRTVAPKWTHVRT
jgi:hypothetical protein